MKQEYSLVLIHQIRSQLQIQLTHLHKQNDIHRNIYEVMIVIQVQSQLDIQQVK